MKVSCPKCGSEAISEKHQAFCYAKVTEWSWDAENELPFPEDADTESFPDWEPYEGRYQFACGRCNWEGNINDLKVERDEGDDV